MRGYILYGLILIVLVTLAAHGLALFDGKVLDDFWHQRGLHEYGWSFSDLMRTLNIAPADFLHTWWQTEDVQWHYLRPFFIVCMKFVFLVLGGGDPISLHAFSILMHGVSAILVWRLCWLLTRTASWSLVGALLFVVYPNSAITVSWPSTQNVVIQTALLLAALLCYIRASGLSLEPRLCSQRDSDMPPPPFDRRCLALTIFLWLLAILTRENAVLAPAILAALDYSFGGRRHLWVRRYFHAFALSVSCAFMLWRESLHVHPLPDIYCRRFSGGAFQYATWLSAKFLHYVTASIWPAPMSIGPTGRVDPWRDVPGDCLFMLGIVVSIGAIYMLATRRYRGWWVWPLWICMGIVPVTAVVATPHSGYMSGVGFAIGLCLACSLVARQANQSIRRITISTAAGLILGMSFMMPVNRLQWIAIYSAERLAPGWVMRNPPAKEVTDVFFINMPFVNIYMKPNLVDRLGPSFEKTNVHVLTYAPYGLVTDNPVIVERVSDRSISVESRKRAFFSGFLGRFLLDGFSDGRPFVTGQQITGRSFDVRIARADREGVWKVVFVFPRPLTDPAYCFYLTSPACGAARLRFSAPSPFQGEGRGEGPNAPPDPSRERQSKSRRGDRPAPFDQSRARKEAVHVDEEGVRELARLLQAGHANAAQPLFSVVESAGTLAPLAEKSLHPILAHMSQATGAAVQSLLDQENLSNEDWARLREWWIASIDSQSMKELWEPRRDFDHLLYLASEIEWDRYLASLVIDTDLYLTGPPFDGPSGDWPSRF
jgi:hypothetical protein